MVILKLEAIIFKGSDDHTVGYRKKAFEYLSADKENDSSTDIVRKMREGQFKWVVAETRDKARELMRKQVAETISAVSWMKPDLNDFYFTVLYSDAENGLFWIPDLNDCKSYRVSDLAAW